MKSVSESRPGPDEDAKLLGSGMALGAVLPLAFASDTLSITIMEIVDNLIIVVIPGAMDAGLRSQHCWGSHAFSLAVGTIGPRNSTLRLEI